jgi:5-methylthioadenosine/S-adenosylhomocysteine deaminase
MDAALPAVAAGDVLIRDDRIEAIAAELPSAEGIEIIDAAGMIAMPGLINAHLHTWQTALRGLAADWTITQYMRAMHAGLATLFRPEDIHIATVMGALNQINCGTTTLVDWCHNNPTPEHTDAAVAGLTESGIRAVFLHGSPKPDPKPGQRHFSEIPMPRAEVERLRNGPLSSGDALVTLGLAILGPAYSTYEVARADMRLARELDLLASMHVGGGAMRTPDGFERLAAEGLLGPRMNIVHGNSLTDAQLAMLAEAGTVFTVTADVELQMGFGNSLTGRLRALNAPVTIGPDVEPAVRGDMFTAMRTTLQAQRHLDNVQSLKSTGVAPETSTITCREALAWATVNGAKLLNGTNRVGSLAPGKQADLILLRANDLNLAPAHDPINSIVAHAGPENVDTVFIAGRMVKRAGRLLAADLDPKREALAQSGRRIWSDFQRLRQ